MIITVKHFFDAAHQLKDTPQLATKGCARLHGHTYCVEVGVTCEKLNEAGMVIDFKSIKQVIDKLDHQFINDIFEKEHITLQPTAENIAIVLADWINKLDNVIVEVVKVCEGYKGIEKASWAIYTPQYN